MKAPATPVVAPAPEPTSTDDAAKATAVPAATPAAPVSVAKEELAVVATNGAAAIAGRAGFAATCTVINSTPVSASIRFPFLMLPVELPHSVVRAVVRLRVAVCHILVRSATAGLRSAS